MPPAFRNCLSLGKGHADRRHFCFTDLLGTVMKTYGVCNFGSHIGWGSADVRILLRLCVHWRESDQALPRSSECRCKALPITSPPAYSVRNRFTTNSGGLAQSLNPLAWHSSDPSPVAQTDFQKVAPETQHHQQGSDHGRVEKTDDICSLEPDSFVSATWNPHWFTR